METIAQLGGRAITIIDVHLLQSFVWVQGGVVGGGEGD